MNTLFKKIFHQRLSVLLLVVLTILFISNTKANWTYLVTATLLNLSFLYYSRSRSTTPSLGLDLAILSYAIADLFFLTNAQSNLFFTIGSLFFILNTLLFAYLIFSCSEKIQKGYYLMGPSLLIPYYAILVSHVWEDLGNQFWLFLLKYISSTILASISFAHFTKFPTFKNSYVLFGTIFLLLNELLFSYNMFYFKTRFFSYEITLSSILFRLFIISFLVKSLGQKKLLFDRKQKEDN